MLDSIQIWEHEDQINPLNSLFLKPFLNSRCSMAGCIVLQKEATTIREYHCHEGLYLVFTNVQAGGLCKVSSHMNDSTLRFPVEHC